MTKVRQDAWSHEDDLLLAETVLRHIREGSTQLEAFEEVGDNLNRTGAACGFRWNAIVRKKYEQAIEIAKKQRKQRKRAEQRAKSLKKEPAFVPHALYENQGGESEQEPLALLLEDESGGQTEAVPEPAALDLNTLSLADVIAFLQNLQTNGHSTARLEQENAHLAEEKKKLEQKVASLENEIKSLQNKQQTIEEDYQSLIGIMERARRMVAFQDQDGAAGSTFKMDKNGNLEKLAK